VVAMAPVSPKFPTLLSITTTGFGKRSPTDDYRETKRGAKGVRTIKTGGRNGTVVAVLPTGDASEVLVTTHRGITIRMAVKGIRSQARNTLGVRVIRLDEGDEVRDAVILEPTIETEASEAPSGKLGPTRVPDEETEEGPAEETEGDEKDLLRSEDGAEKTDEDGEDDDAPPPETG